MSHVVTIPIRFGHVDQARIVYYPHLFHYCHVAMEETFGAAVGITYADLLLKEKLGFPAVHVETDFLETVGYGDSLNVAVSAPMLGRTSATFRFEAARASDGVLAFRAEIKTVCVDMTTFRPVPIPEKIRAALGKLA